MASQTATSMSCPDTPQSKSLKPKALPIEVDHIPGAQPRCSVKRLHIPVDDANGPGGKVTGFLHTPLPYKPGEHNKTAAVLLSGAGGGVTGPSGMYLSMADKMASLPTTEQAMLALRLDYRYPARNKYCVPDVKAAVDYLQSVHQIQKVVLVGWSFGSAPLFTFAAQDSRVKGAACVAPQTAETEGISRFPPRPLLLCHGTGDRTLSPRCSRDLERRYREADRRGHCQVEVKLYEGDDHALTGHAQGAETEITEFILRCAGVHLSEGIKDAAEARSLPVGRAERVELMEQGGDLKGHESVE